MKVFIKVTKALSDPSRVKIVKMLSQGSMFVSEIQAALGISQSSVSNISGYLRMPVLSVSTKRAPG